MNDLKRILSYLVGLVYIDPTLLRIQGAKVLHISDTPDRFFPSLKKLIRQLKPDYIIHTGDLVDNIKLEIYPGSLYRYERELRILVDLLEKSDVKGIYICLGNHDHYETLNKLSSRISIVPDHEVIWIEGRSFGISHYSDVLVGGSAQFNCFGHDLKMRSQIEGERLFLNGISNIHLIELETGMCHTLDYPWGTDDQRLGKGRVGF